MNRRTFGDMMGAQKGFTEDVESEGDDDEEEAWRGGRDSAIEGEEADGTDKFNDAGIAIEPFNMKDEREGGRIDGNMNYTYDKEEGDPDSWIAGLDEAAEEKMIGEAREAAEKRRVRSRKDAMQEAKSARPQRSAKDLKVAIVRILEEDESIAAALKRLVKETSSEKTRTGKRDTSGVDMLTDLVNAMSEAGEPLSYSTTKEGLENEIVTWEYRALDGSVQGPYPTTTMSAWLDAGFFSGASAVYLRKIYPQETPGGGHDGAHDGPSSKRARVADLENDFDDSDDDDDGGGDGGDGGGDGINSATDTSATHQEKGPWISSNDVDFGSRST